MITRQPNMMPPTHQPPRQAGPFPHEVFQRALQASTSGQGGSSFNAAPATVLPTQQLNPNAGQIGLMPPISGAGVINATTGANPFPYAAFQKALQASGRGTTNVTDPANAFTLDGAGTGNDSTTAARSAGEGAAGNPDPMTPGPHEEMGLDPFNYVAPGTTLPLSGSEPPPDTTGNNDYGDGPPAWWAQEPDPTGIGNDPYLPNYSDPDASDNARSNPDEGGHGSGRGGMEGGGGGESWQGKLFRLMAPWQIANLTHAGLEAYRAWRLAHPEAGPGGRGGGGSGGGRGGYETPAERARGDRNFGLAGGSIPGASYATNSHFNYGTGRYEANNATGPGFRNSPNQGAEQQARNPMKFGYRAPTEGGNRINAFGQANMARRRAGFVDPNEAALRAWAALHSNTRQLYGG